MGHRHTPEEQRNARAVRGLAGGPVAGAAEPVEASSAAFDNLLETFDILPVGAQHQVGVRLALFALRFYKTYLSVLMAGSCRFHPTCSIYAYQAVERFGVWRGCWIALKRLLRCHPLSRRFGYDPVPDAWPGSEEAEGFRQGLNTNNDPLLEADLKVRPSTAQQEAHS